MPNLSQYFASITQALKQAHIHQPTLVLDKTRLLHNAQQLAHNLPNTQLRLVAKSLPSLPLLALLMRQLNTQRLMSFHLPFLRQLISHFPHSDILLGKPMPIGGAEQLYQWLSQQPHKLTAEFNSQQQLHWLVDSLERLQQYQALAERLNIVISVNLEINVGLNRGGFAFGKNHQQAFIEALTLIEQSPHLTLHGLMGYDAHISHIPKALGQGLASWRNTQARYQHFIELVSRHTPSQAANLCLNTGGSSTYALYNPAHTSIKVANEIACASALVQPTDFDSPLLAQHQPALFIAAPILKQVQPSIPEAPKLSTALRYLGALPKQGIYIYGGNWLATPYYPQDVRLNSVFGRSSNQEFYQTVVNSTATPDNYLFLRPTQSEAVMLQFGDIAVYEDGKITKFWPVLEQRYEHQGALPC